VSVGVKLAVWLGWYVVAAFLSHSAVSKAGLYLPERSPAKSNDTTEPMLARPALMI